MSPEEFRGFADTVKQSNVMNTARRAIGTAATVAAKPGRRAAQTAATMAGAPVGAGARAAHSAAKAQTVAETVAKPGVLGAVGSHVARGLDRLGGAGTKLVNHLGARNVAAGHGSASGVRALRQVGGGALVAGGVGATGLGAGAVLARNRGQRG